MNGGEPLHPGRQRQEQRQSFPIAYLADDGHIGSHAEEPADEPPKIDRRAIGARRTCLHVGDVHEREIRLENLLRHYDAQGRIELRRTAGQHRGLARAGSTGEHDRGAGAHASRQEARAGRRDRGPLDEFVEGTKGNTGEFPDVDDDVAAPGNVAVDDVQSRAVVELRVLQPFGRVELAMRAGRVVENLRQYAQHVLVVVEDLVVVPHSGRRAASRRSHRDCSP